MAKLVLHIGNHKTGTTSIQKSLYDNRKELREQGYSPFLDTPKTGKGKELVTNHNWIFNNLFGNTNNFRNKGVSVRKIFFSKLRDKNYTDETVIISSEDFSFMFDIKEIKLLYRELSTIFDAIQVIVYLRRQDKHLVSHHQQGCKSPGPASKFYGNEPVAMPDYQTHFDNYLDYNYRIGMWASVFGKNNLVIRIFDKKYLIDGDTVADFYSVLGIIKPENNASKVNISLCKKLEKTKHIAVRLGYSGKECRLLNSIIPKEGETMKASSEESKIILSKYRKSNEELRNFFNIKLDFFESDSIAYSKDNSKWEEEEANEVIEALLKYIQFNLINKSNANLFCDAALMLEDQDLSKAYALMKLAHKLKPKRSFIKRKLEEYKKKLL